jgi:hypothetical protein
MRKFNIEHVKEVVEKCGYTLLSDKYIGIHTKLDMLCENNHKCSINFHNFKNNTRCKQCMKDKLKSNIKDIEDQISEQGHILLSKEYTNAHRKLEIKCPKGHVYSCSFNKFQQGVRCSICNNTKPLEYAYIKEYIESFGYSLISKSYINNRVKLDIKCTDGHSFCMRFNDFKDLGHRCPTCNKSKTEEKCREIFETLTDKEFPTKRPKWLINPETKRRLELDGYCEELKIAFEYDGEFHYKVIKGMNNNKDLDMIKKRDHIKDILCEDNDIYLIRIPYFIDDKEQYIESKLKDFYDSN